MLRVTDLDRAVEFYTKALGMQLLRQQEFPEGRFTLAFVGYGDEQEHAVLELTHNWDTDSYDRGDAYGHIAVQCDDLHATCARVRSSAGELLREPFEMQDGPLMAFARDPDGYVIELLPADVFDWLAQNFPRGD
jgi:lactoylglutathione lyase